MRISPLAAVLCCLVAACSSSGVFLEPPRANPGAGLAAPNQYGKMVSLKEACAGPWAVIFFYPQADTPG